jgi:hypothetical protein
VKNLISNDSLNKNANNKLLEELTAACTSGDSATKYSESPNEEFEKY